MGAIFLKSEFKIKFNFFVDGISSKSLIIKMSSSEKFLQTVLI